MAPQNRYVDLDGRTYRVCRLRPGQPFVGMVMLRSTKARGGRERPLDPDGRRARQVIAAEAKTGRDTSEAKPITCGDCERRVDLPGFQCTDRHCPYAGTFGS